MGCDIHLYIEIKTKNGWELYGHPSIKRNYALFAKMANVRNNDNLIQPLNYIMKGIPDDASYIVKMCYEEWKRDAHHITFLNSNEIKELDTWLFQELKIDLEGILHCYLEGHSFCYIDDFPSWIQDVRFIFWFDN